MKEIKEIGIMSLAKMQALLMGIIGVLAGIIYLLIGVIMAAVSGEPMMAFIFLMIGIFMPVGYAAMGFLMGALMSWIYNILAKKIGGIQIELK